MNFMTGDWLRNQHCVAEVVELYDSHGQDGPQVYPMMRLRPVLLESKAHLDRWTGKKWGKRIGLPKTEHHKQGPLAWTDTSIQPAGSPHWAKLTGTQLRNVRCDIADLAAGRCSSATEVPRTSHQSRAQPACGVAETNGGVDTISNTRQRHADAQPLAASTT